ncbi:MAG: ABC transporter ATP-binding protein [Candidatus Tectomicrobia bacterium]|nr:ABC transporter ATP-binding protein [Candidatus Tectomicrobia bacterium]
MPWLSVRDLSVAYGDLEALHGVNLELERGESVAIIGGNGAGKTTALKTISGVLRPRQGAVELDGRAIGGLPPHQIVARGIGHIPEGRQLFPSMTVVENLTLGARTPRAKAARSASLDRVFGLFPLLAQRRRQLAGTLSGGEQQMLAIGRGLMGLPSTLLFDEPSLGLAPRLVAEMFAIIRAINADGVTVLLVEQNVYQALTLCRRGYVLENGRIVLAGDSSALLNDPYVREAYLGM